MPVRGWPQLVAPSTGTTLTSHEGWRGSLASGTAVPDRSPTCRRTRLSRGRTRTDTRVGVRAVYRRDEGVRPNEREPSDFDDMFGRWSFRRITRALDGRPEPALVRLDLHNVDHAFATAVVPLISLVRHLQAQGTRVEIGYPHDDGYWRLAGWIELLEGGEVLVRNGDAASDYCGAVPGTSLSLIVPAAKRHARAQGVSLSSLIEKSLREVVDADEPSFASRWRGRFRAAQRDDARYDALARKHLR